MLLHLHRSVNRPVIILLSVTLFALTIQQMQAAEPDVLPNTKQLMPQKMSLDKRMVAGIDKFATRALQQSRNARLKAWLHDFNTLDHGAFQKKMAEKRERLKTIIGVVDERVKPSRFEYGKVFATGVYQREMNGKSGSVDLGKHAVNVTLVKWQVMEGVTAEGLLLYPVKRFIKAHVIVIPDAAWTPEQFIGLKRYRSTTAKLTLPKLRPTEAELKKGATEDKIIKSVGKTRQLAYELVTQGCEVVIPLLINRESTHSGHKDVFYTNIPHREWIYRMSFEMGRHITGYEVQKVLAAVDLFESDDQQDQVEVEANPSNETRLHVSGKRLPIGVVGVGEGGLIAMLAGAIDTRIQSTMVCGYFNQREQVYDEPIYRNIWSQLTEFGDAEIAALVAPRRLTIEACAAPEISDSRVPIEGRRTNAAPGIIHTPEIDSVKTEFHRAKDYFDKLGSQETISLAISDEGKGAAGSQPALQSFGKGLKLTIDQLNGGGWIYLDLVFELMKNGTTRKHHTLPEARQHRQFKELTVFTQNLLRISAKKRDIFWKKADRTSLQSWKKTSQWYRDHIHEEMFGKLPEPTMPLNPKSRKVIDVETHTGYEITIDVYPDIFAGGILLLPKGMKQGEKRAVVVCQHGLEGRSIDTISSDPKPFRPYKAFATQLVKLGYIVYAPQNPYIGEDRFRLLQRKSNPLKRSLYSYIIPQHQQTLKWLATLPNVDAKRIAFYGLSYGGKTAVRVPPFLPPKKDQPGYCLSICSADFNEWVKKCVSDEDRYSYVFHGEYETWEWNMGHVANYAELSTLMTPRPFMVERGHNDGVAPDEWVAWEYSKVRRHYDQIGIGHRTKIEWFNGPHTINGKGTFNFLQKHLK